MLACQVLVLKPLMKKISPKAWGSPLAARSAGKRTRKGTISDAGSGTALDLPFQAVVGEGPVGMVTRQRTLSFNERVVSGFRMTEPDAVLRRQGVMHDLQPIDEEALDAFNGDLIRPAPKLTRSISPFCIDQGPEAAPTRKVDLGDMDFMDFLALSEADMDGLGVGGRRPSGQSTEKGPLLDQGFVTVKQPAAICNELSARDPPRQPGPQPDTIPSRKRRMTMLTLRSGTSGTSQVRKGSQAPDTAFSDFVNLTSSKPLTELTRTEAFWPIMSGKLALQNDDIAGETE